MKIRKILSAAILMSAFNTMAVDKVVYGEDNRLDLFEVERALHLDLAASTAGMIPNYRVEDLNDGTVKLSGSKLSVCSGEKFNGQLTAANCSGFLVGHKGKQYMVTAGHCVTSQSACKNSKWVFDYKMNEAGQQEHIISKNSVYSCKNLVERKLISSTKDDYAVIELDREVTDRAALNIRYEGEIEVGEEVLVIGHPTGLPTKVAGDAFVRDNSRSKYFETNLDTFAGNSGSAVFNAASGTVEGILVRGHTDYEWKRVNGKSCKAPVYCQMDSCRGEDVTKITSIDFFQN